MLRDINEETGMSIESVKNWPIAAICLPRGNVTQRESISYLPLSDRGDSPVRSSNIDANAKTMWEKGMFIDLYT